MKVLNLTNKDASEIKYQIYPFPDGQQQIVIDISKQGYSNSIKYTKVDFSVEIKSRLNNFKDLELIICATKSLRNLGVKQIHLYTPYFLGSRSDRKFEEGSNNYLKDVICPIINSLNFESVTVLDPHSDVLEACIKGFRKESNLGLVKFSISNLYNNKKGILDLVGGDGEDGEGLDYFWMKCRDCGEYTTQPKDSNKEHFCPDCNKNINNFILVSPDAGASKKIYKLAEQIGYKGDIITCSKDRDTDGKLTKTTVPMSIDYWNTKDKIIIDDICDGGATFINIAKEFKKDAYQQKNNSKIYLIVTHGIFSKGFKELSQYFDGIYCTNSYSTLPEWLDEEGQIITEETHTVGKGKFPSFVKQLNVF